MKNRVGEKYLSRTNGEVTIVKYNNARDITVITGSGTIISGLTFGNVKRGHVGSDITNRKGEKFINKEGYEMEIIEYFSATNCTVRFDDGTTLYKQRYDNIKRGVTTNPNYKFLYGIGYLGEGDYKTSIGENVFKYYRVWYSMFLRCYSEKHKKEFPSYIGCSVNERWHNFQNFVKWYEKNYNPEIMKGWHLDKDILVKGNKVYSPKTCAFVPAEINTLFLRCNKSRGNLPIGVSRAKSGKFIATLKKKILGKFKTPEEAFKAYKTAKEAYIKEIAEKWRGKISEKVYDALHKYQVEITD